MRTIAIAITLAVELALPDLALAQTKSPTGMAPARPAPVGHRQPTAKDVPQDATQPVEMSKEDRALDRALKNICRGC